jgi:FdrA protein
VIHRVKVFPGTYLDSVLQMGGTRALSQVEGVDWAAAAMATPANIDTLVGEGFDRSDLDGASADDLFVAVRAADDEAADAAIAAGEAVLFASRGDAASTGAAAGAGGERAARTLEEATGANVAIISVPGDYAAMEAHKALSAGLHVLLFSDNVSVEDEVELKDRATELGRLVMGPGAGTAMLGGTGLGFANAVRPAEPECGPRVAVVAAAGTGAQEAMSLLDRWGATVTHVIGVGGRDLSDAVDGRMAKLAVAALRDDPGTDAILLVSKPPSPRVAQAVIDVASAGATPLVAALVGIEDGAGYGVAVLPTLEEGVMAALAAVGREAPDVTAGLNAAVAQAAAGLGADRTLIRGLFSGGTLCYESLVILTRLLGPVWSNTPLNHAYEVPAPDSSHVCLDLGEEEYTKGRPHPMIDPGARIDWIRQEGSRADVAVVLIDVVLGHGSHPDPAGELAPVCEEIRAGGAGPAVVAYVLGTDADPQGFAGQVARMEAAGCVVTATAARASLAAAAIALRRPDLATSRL